MVFADSRQCAQYILFHILGQFLVCPQVVKPCAEFGAYSRVASRQIDFHICTRSTAQTAAGKVGTADHCCAAIFGFGEVHFTVQKIGFADRANFDSSAAYPFGALLREIFLLQCVIRREPAFDQVKRFFRFLAGIYFANRCRIAKEKAYVLYTVQFVL